MFGRGRPGFWSVLVLVGISTALPALGWIGSSHPMGRDGVADAVADGFFSTLTLVAAPAPPAPAAPVLAPRVPTGSILGRARAGSPLG